MFELPPEIRAEVAALASNLSAFTNESREVFEGRTERWQEGADGMAADAWIEELGNLADALENLPEKPE